MLSRVTDLALEVRESFPDDNVEISGVKIIKRDTGVSGISMTEVEIKDEHGKKAMGKPVGKYITLEFSDREWEKSDETGLEKVLAGIVESIIVEKVSKNREVAGSVLGEGDENINIKKNKKNEDWENQKKNKEDEDNDRIKKGKTGENEECDKSNKKRIYGENSEIKIDNITVSRDKADKRIMIAGLGNRYATPDMLGNKVVEYIDIVPEKICAIAPGVLSQTGMETCDIIRNIVCKGDFDCIIVIDSLCSTHTERLCHTIQVTDTGISPGAGVGNRRKEINGDVMGIPVIAIGVPTVVSMATVAYDCIEETLLKQGFSQQETDIFLNGMSNDKYSGLFVTPKDIDEQIFFIGKAIAGGLNMALQK